MAERAGWVRARTGAPAIVIVAALCAGAPFGAPAAAPAPASGAVVRLTNTLTFEPKVATIRAGQAVTWRNGSLLVHTVTADPALAANAKDVALPAGARPFNSGDLKPDAAYRHIFTVPGRYRYFCIPHEGAGMVGEVVVLPAAMPSR